MQGVAPDAAIEALTRLVGTEVDVIVDLLVDGEWKMLTISHGVLSGPFGGEPGGDWLLSDKPSLSVETVRLRKVSQQGPWVVLDFGDVRARVAPDPPR